jgi:hypothetical protein
VSGIIEWAGVKREPLLGQFCIACIGIKIHWLFGLERLRYAGAYIALAVPEGEDEDFCVIQVRRR